MTIKEFFRKHAADQARLTDLKYRLKVIDCPRVATTRTKQVKVQGGKSIKEEDKFIGNDRKREQLEYEIAMLEFEVSRVENALKAIGEDGPYSARMLKRKYINCHSINKIATDFDLSYSKVKKILKDTEKMLLWLIN